MAKGSNDMVLGLERKQLVMVTVLLAGTFVAVLNATLLTPALPSIMRDMSVAQTTVQWLTSGYALVEAVVIPLAAYLMGRFPTRRLYLTGIALFGVGSLVAAFAPSFPFLLAGRMIQAACTGAVLPMVMSVVLLEFPRERRGSAMGIVGLLIGFAPAIGPSLSGVLIDTVGWRWIFGIVAIISFCIVAAACAVLKNVALFKRTKFDALSVILSTIGLLSLLYGLSTFSSSDNHAVTAALIVVGIAFVGLYAYRQLHLDEPMLRVGILKVRNYRTVVVIVMLFQAALMGMETIMPLYIQGVLGEPATVSGLALLPGAVIGAVVGVFSGRLFDRYGVRGLVLSGAALITVASVGFAFYAVDSHIFLVSGVYTLMAIGMQFTMTPLNTWGVNSLPNDAIQHAQSTSNTLNQVAGSFGTALLVSISSAVSNASGLSGVEQTFAGYHASFATTAALAIVAALVIVVFVRDRKAAGARAGAVSTPRGAAAQAGARVQGAAGRKAEAGVVAAQGIPATKGAADVPLAVGERAAEEILVRDAMNPAAATVSVEASMGEVIELIGATDTTGVSVVDASGALVGYVTDGDVARYLARDQGYSSIAGNLFWFFQDADDLRERMTALAQTNVMDLATKRVVAVEASMPLDRACAILAERKIKKVPVTENGVLVGALSRRNVMHFLIGEFKGARENGAA